MNFVMSTLQAMKSAFQIRRLISLCLMLVLTANPILAMPGLGASLSNELSYSLAFQWYNSGWAAKFNAWFPNKAAVQDTNCRRPRRAGRQL